MADVNPLEVPLPEDGPPQPQQPRDIKLPPFWPTRPRAWFTYVEGRFRLRGIDDQQQMFDNVLGALPPDMVGRILDIIDQMPEANPYTWFKQQLLTSQQMSDYEKFDRLVKMEPMGGHKPSQLFHDMIEVCPAGMETTLPFHYFFMQRLPPALKSQLGETQPGDPRTLAQRADQLWVVISTAAAATVAAVESLPDPAAAVAAVRGTGRGLRGAFSRGNQRGRGRPAPTAAAGAGSTAKEPTPSDLARASSGLCFYHWTWAEKAGKCQPPCSWGN